MINNWKKSVTCLAACFAMGAAGAAAAQVKWDLPTPYLPTDHHVENLELFAKDVAQASNGQLTITVHNSGSLFKQPEIKRAIQSGQVPIGEFVLSQYQNEWPLFGVDNVPFLASSEKDAATLYKVQKPYLDKYLDKQGLMILYTVPWPPQGIYTNRDLNSGADFKGLKWRSYSPGTHRVGQLLDAQPVNITAAELAQAMATGVVDSYMSSATTGVATKTYEHLSHFYDVRGWIPKNAVVVSKKAFDGLAPELQKALLDSAATAETRGWDMARVKSEQDKQSLADSGMQVLEPSDQLKSDLAKVGETMLTEWVKDAGDDGKALIEAYHKAQAEGN